MRSGRRILAAIFDLDGTLVDSEPLYAESDTAFLAENGIILGPMEAESLLGIGVRESFVILERLFPASPLCALPVEERIRRKDLRFLAYAAGREIAFPAALGLVAELSRRGIPLAVASGSSPLVIDTMLRDTGLKPSFAWILSSMEVARGKPEPDLFLETARRLGVDPGSCIVFEDSRPGVLAAVRAGMACVALPAPGTPPDPDLARADVLVEGGPAALDVEALLRRLEELGFLLGG